MTFELKNPFRPGAGHMPPYLAGREPEIEEFKKILKQDVILENMVLTGLRGVGKTVLLDTLKPIAINEGWVWVGTDLSESASLSEENIAIRLLTDLSVVTASIITGSITQKPKIGFGITPDLIPATLNYQTLVRIYQETPGLSADKLKRVLEVVYAYIENIPAVKGFVFAYDEAQNLSDHTSKNEYPLSLLLDVFQSIQKKGIKFIIILTGLPTLFPKLVEARTFAERMFRVVFLDKLTKEASRDAIVIPITQQNCPLSFSEESIKTIIAVSKGYPYFIQFICREVFDIFVQNYNTGKELPKVPVQEILRKLDTDFFAGRYARATDRQRDLLKLIAQLGNADNEFTVHEVVNLSKKDQEKSFSSSHVNQMLNTLTDSGLIYKNRHGKYSFAVPLLGQFIRRQMNQNINNELMEE
ncbi:MAG TPA: ATP-binding protein [Smithellaceae bacterium]|nr:ATP-binding protein [Smithellaceae bacterium]